MNCQRCGKDWTRRLGEVTKDRSGRWLHAVCRRIVNSHRVAGACPPGAGEEA